MGDPITAGVAAAVSLYSAYSSSKAAKEQTAAARAASEAEQAYNEKVLTEQRNAALLENQANLNTTKVETAGAAAASEEAGYSGSEIRRKKANMTSVSSSLGF